MSAEAHQSLGAVLATLLSIAWLLPLAGFSVEIFGGWWSGRRSKSAAYMAVACIATGFICSLAALLHWGSETDWAVLATHDDHGAAHASDDAHADDAHTPADGEAHEHGEEGHTHADEEAHAHADGEHAHAEGEHAEGEDHAHAAAGDLATQPFSGRFYTLASFGRLVVSLDYYIDSLTLVMFTMVTFIATCIHIFATGYMSEELTDDYVDHQVHLPGGKHFHRPGRYYRFFAFLSLFCFSMLGLVLAGNIFQVFIFWELVGICSYFLIGFYVERKSASNAANKAFIMNRVGDFGFLIGLMIIWTYFGTFNFGEQTIDGRTQPGLFQMIRGTDGELHVDAARDVVTFQNANPDLQGVPTAIPYMLLVAAGLGIFAGCVGKSAQFPLQTWLPDAMEGPTPVSALVHSATMVAAGVYLAGRFYPMFTPEVLLVIAYVGCITLFIAATIAIVATDIKKVLAYSTISQLGYMMLAIGVGGWGAGLFHLITHAFFKSLMFLASGSVINACHHEQEMTRMGGLRRKMPITAYTMLVGVIAIAGLAVPGTPLAFSGYHSKDAILATALAHTTLNPNHFLLFLFPLVTAGITAFYMFRLWFFTFAGEPRDHHIYDHAHETPWPMTGPLIVLAILAALCAVGGEGGFLYTMLIGSEPAGVAHGVAATETVGYALPGHDLIHRVHAQAGAYALIAATLGLVVAYLLYGARVLNPADIKRQLATVHGFLVEKWQFDRLYDAAFVRPTHVVAGWCAAFDRVVLDGILHATTRVAVGVAGWGRRFDEGIIDGLVNLSGDVVYAMGRSFKRIQTGRIRQYVMFIGIGVLAVFVLVFALAPK